MTRRIERVLYTFDFKLVVYCLLEGIAVKTTDELMEKARKFLAESQVRPGKSLSEKMKHKILQKLEKSPLPFY